MKKKAPCFRKRNELFKDFRENYINHTAPCTASNISDICSDFDVYICGSDQIWKPTVANDAYMLAFAPKGKPKCSYAASLSVDSLDKKYHEKFKNWLKSFDRISVREEQATRILAPMTDKKIEWVLDPSLLLNSEEWLSYAGEPDNNEDYIFCYFLGDDSIHRSVVRKYAKKTGLKIITLPDLQQSPRSVDAYFGDERRYDVSPLDFVRLIKGAKCVFTDSFHATAFSLNLGTPFFVFERGAISSMNSRITSLLKMTGCESRFVPEPKKIEKAEDSGIDWTYVKESIEKHREQSLKYITDCLELSEG